MNVTFLNILCQSFKEYYQANNYNNKLISVSALP